MAGFVYGENCILIDKFSHFKEDKNIGNPYNTSFDLIIKSNGFSGCAHCECDIDSLCLFINQLEELYAFELNNAEFNDICYGSRIQFLMDGGGHIEVMGDIFSERKEQCLKFVFSADQTALKSFINELKQLAEV